MERKLFHASTVNVCIFADSSFMGYDALHIVKESNLVLLGPEFGCCQLPRNIYVYFPVGTT